MLSWLKDCEGGADRHTHTFSISNHKADYSYLSSLNVPNEDVLTSADLFLVRNYITNHNLMSGLTQKEVCDLFTLFPLLHSAFDNGKLINEFIYVSEKTLHCIICKKSFKSPHEVVESLECKGETFHPKHAMKNEKANCYHEGCQKKLTKGELSCCHKAINTTGCTLGEGKHMIVIED